MDIRKIPIYGFIVACVRANRVLRKCKQFPGPNNLPRLYEAKADMDSAFLWTVGFIIGLIVAVQISVMLGGK